MQTWKTRDRQIILEQRPWLVVEHHTVELPDGRVIANWPWVITPDYINVVALTTANTFLCFRQTKYAIGSVSLALVGGYLEPGEEPLAAAQRELREETGYAAAEWVNLGSYRVDANRGAGVGHLFFARQAQLVSAITADDLEEQQLLHLNYTELAQALVKGEFKVLAWTTAVALALLHMQGEGLGPQ